MPKPKPRELGTRESFSLRGGIDIPSWGGINLQEDAGAIADNQFRELINVSHKGTKLIDRPGLTKIHTTALDGEVRGVFDPVLHGGLGGDPELQEVAGTTDCSPVTGYGTSGVRYYVVGRDTCSPQDFLLYHFAYDQSPKLQKLRLDPHAMDFSHYGGYGLHSDGTVLWVTTGSYAVTDTVTMVARQLPQRHFGISPKEVARVSAAYTANSEAGITANIMGHSGSTSFYGSRYFANSTVAFLSSTDIKLYIWRFDGLNVVLEDTPYNTDPATDAKMYAVNLAQRGEELVAAVAIANDPATPTFVPTFPNTIRKRTTAGAWSGVSLPGTVQDFGATIGRMVVYKDKLYIFGCGVMPGVHATRVGGIVLEYDGSTLAVSQNTIATSSDSRNYAFRCPVLFNGYLYYLHTPSGSTTAVYVGRFDGSSWDNTHKQLSTQFAVTDPSDIACLEVFKGELVATAYSSATTTDRIVASPGTSTAGTWTVEAQHSTAKIFQGGATVTYGTSGQQYGVL